MSARLFPDLNQIKYFKNPLDKKTLGLIQFLDNHLKDKLHIYVRPHLNGDEPDIVILNPNKGLMLINVLGWKPGQISSAVEKKQSRSGGRFGRYSIDIRKYYSIEKGQKQQLADPVSHIRSQASNLMNIYVPEIGKKFNGKIGRNIQVGLYTPYLSMNEALEILKVSLNKCNILGNEDLNPFQLNNFVLYLNQNPPVWPEWEQEWLEELRFWLVPPLHKIEDGININLTAEQQKHIEPAKGKHQRLRGVAGSGKTLVIAQRAARIASQGKNVLIATFNITLMQYIREHLNRASYEFNWSNIVIKHFHGFCRGYLSDNEVPWPTGNDHESEKITESRLGVHVPKLVIQTKREGKNCKDIKFDAIVIDEGQDFNRAWYECLCEFLTDNDEVLFVTDEKQNIYERDEKWIDKMEGGGKFNKRWRELKATYRFPKTITEQANRFSEIYLGNDEISLIDAKHDITLFEPHIVWKNYFENSDMRKVCFETIKSLIENHNQHLEDIIIQVGTHKQGINIYDFLKHQYINTGGKKVKLNINHIFERQGQSNIRKFTFKTDEKGLKMSTINSFKGWEILTVILIIPESAKGYFGKLDHLIYTAITRARSNLIVINQNERYKDFGESWPVAWGDNFTN